MSALGGALAQLIYSSLFWGTSDESMEAEAVFSRCCRMFPRRLEPGFHVNPQNPAAYYDKPTVIALIQSVL